MEVLRAIWLVAILALSGIAVMSQSFPFQDFKPRTLSELAGMEKDVEKDRDADGKPGVVFHGDMMMTRARVVYTGASRPMSDAKKDLLSKWAEMFTENKEAYSKLYEADWLFTENSIEYWLPVQKKVSGYFEKELKKGDEVDLFIVRAGGIYVKHKWDWLLFVEEYQKVKKENVLIK